MGTLTSQAPGSAVADTAEDRPLAPPSTSATATRRPLLLLAALALALRLPIALSSRMVHVDEGVYGASVDAIRSGSAPFREVFSSQGPLFLPLLSLADLLGLGWWAAPRIAGIAGGVVLTLACFGVVQRRAGTHTACIASLLVSASGSVLVATSAAITEGVVLGLTASAMLLADRLRERSNRAAMVALVLCLGAAFATKSVFAVPAIIAAGVAIWPLVGPRHALTAAAGIPLVWFGLALPWGVDAVLDQSVRYHLEGSTGTDPLASATVVLSTIWRADLIALVTSVVLFAAVGVARWRRAVSSMPLEARLRPAPDHLLVWLVCTAVLLVLVSPLWHQHIAYLVPPLVVVAFVRAPAVFSLSQTGSTLAAAALVVLALGAPLVVSSSRGPDHRAQMHEIVTLLRSTSDSEMVISDLPGLAWIARRRMPPALVDADRKQIRAGRITAETLQYESSRQQVCTMVFWSPTKYRTLDFDPTEHGYAIVQRHDLGSHEALVFRKSVCTAQVG